MKFPGARSVTKESFETHALPHIADLFRTANSILRAPSEAEEAVQETYLQAWKF
jgi:DNA-directed RNA polymerase specialized sigma24 family protein